MYHNKPQSLVQGEGVGGFIIPFALFSESLVTMPFHSEGKGQ